MHLKANSRCGSRVLTSNIEFSNYEQEKMDFQSMVKIIMIVCLTVVAGMMMHSCSVSEEMIESCQVACEKDGKMRSVSRFSCKCDNIPDRADIFVK